MDSRKKKSCPRRGYWCKGQTNARTKLSVEALWRLKTSESSECTRGQHKLTLNKEKYECMKIKKTSKTILIILVVSQQEEEVKCA